MSGRLSACDQWEVRCRKDSLHVTNGRSDAGNIRRREDDLTGWVVDGEHATLGKRGSLPPRGRDCD